MIKFSIISNRLVGKSSLVVAGMLTMAFVPLLARPVVAQQFYKQTNLVTDDQDALRDEGFAPATFTDPNLVNPWGVSFAPSGPFWISNQGTGTSTLYNGNGEPFPVGSPLVVNIPQNTSGPAGPTGQIFNNTSDFNLSTGGKGFFFFANLDGSLSGWNPNLGTVAETVVTPTGPALYTGLALGSNSNENFLYAANGITGKIDVFDKNFNPANLAGSFSDPNPNPDGLVPFNIQNLGDKLYVTYAIPGPDADEADLGSGFVNVFDTNGNFIQRLTAGGVLASPWGLAIAPTDFGEFSNALLVGNFNDEHGNVNAFDPNTGNFLGSLRDANGNLISLPYLWALTFGGGTPNNGNTNELFFTAGIGDQLHGVFGKLETASESERVPEPATISLFGASLIPTLMFLTRGKKRGQG